MAKSPFTDLDALLAALAALPPVERVHACRLLTVHETVSAIAALADATVYEMTRTATTPVVAEELGTTVRSVRRAVTTYLERTRP